jgi:hypothetical protein
MRRRFNYDYKNRTVRPGGLCYLICSTSCSSCRVFIHVLATLEKTRQAALRALRVKSLSYQTPRHAGEIDVAIGTGTLCSTSNGFCPI